MATRERNLIEHLLKTWAQSQCSDFIIANFEPSLEGMEVTQGHLTWVVREGNANLNLIELADKFELFLKERRQQRHPDGMNCKKCRNFTQFAEANQSDGSFVCFGCKTNPYR